MFRRKEDSLFDTDPTQDESVESVSSASSISAQPASASAPLSSSSSMGSSAPAYLSNPAPRATEARPASSAPSAASFRPASAAAPASDLSRSRMPEAKPAAPAPTPASPASSFSLSNSANNKPGKRVLTVGNDILLKGEIATCDRLVIEGKVDATLNDVHTVEIAETGSFKGAAHIEDAEISGLFEGDLVVRNRLVIYATGKVRGNITYGEIEIERGGELTGEIKTSNPGSQTASARPSRQKEREAA